MILGFARGNSYADVLTFYKALEALSSTNKMAKFWSKKQAAYWACHNEAMRACEVSYLLDTHALPPTTTCYIGVRATCSFMFYSCFILLYCE